MEVRRSQELAGVARDLYAAMGSATRRRPRRSPACARTRCSWGPTGPSGELLAFECGDVGWTVDRPTIELAGGGRFETRLTFVFHREDGAWKVVHAHTSVGQEGEG